MVELKIVPPGATGHRILSFHATAADALAAVPGTIISSEEDPDHPGCWDVAAARGGRLDIYSIEPARSATFRGPPKVSASRA